MFIYKERNILYYFIDKKKIILINNKICERCFIDNETLKI